MNCGQAQILLSAWLDNELSEEEQHLLEQHVIDCTVCESYGNNLRVLSDCIRQECSMRASVSLEETVLTRIREMKIQRQSAILVRSLMGGVALLLSMMLVAIFLPLASLFFSIMGIGTRLLGHALSLTTATLWVGGNIGIVWAMIFFSLFTVGYLAIRQLSHHAPIHD